MSETVDHFTSVMRRITRDGKISSREAEDLLYAYEKGKKKNLGYTKEELNGLKKALGVDSHEKFFGNAEVQALRKIVSQRVSAILEGKQPSDVTDKKSKDVPDKKKSKDVPDKIPKKVIVIEKPRENLAGIPSVQFKEVEIAKKKKPFIAQEEILLARSNYEKHKAQIWPTIQKIAPLVGLKPQKILAICAQESRFDLGATSPVGAQGIMQIMPSTSRGVINLLKNGTIKNSGPEEKYYAKIRERAEGKAFDINGFIEKSSDIEKNIIVGAIYLSFLLKNYKNDRALQIYNGGMREIKGSKENAKYASGVNAWEKIILVSNNTGKNIA